MVGTRRMSGDLLRVLSGACPLSRSAAGAAGDAPQSTARAISTAGYLALLALPPLLLSSALLSAPLAVPAAIGLAYLPLARAIESGNGPLAKRLGVVIMGALFAWLSFHLALGGSDSVSGLAAALMAPLVAAAPTLVRSLRPTPIKDEMNDVRRAALRRIDCLEEIAPFDPMLILDGEGKTLGATSATRTLLGISSICLDPHVASLLAGEDSEKLHEAIRHCSTGKAVTIAIGADEGARLQATLSSCRDGTIAMRLQELRESRSAPVSATPAVVEAPAPVSDAGEALAFAIRRAEPAAAAKGIRLSSHGDANTVAACDRQLARRILCQAVDAAVCSSSGNGAVDAVIRRLPGVVMVRVGWRAEPVADGLPCVQGDGLDVEILQTLAEAAGGTMIAASDGAKRSLTLRLPAAIEMRGAQVRRGETRV